MSAPAVGRGDRRARAAVAGLFVVNGATYTSLVPWFPALKNGLGLSNTAFGTAIAAFPAAALLLGMFAGPLIARFGSARIAVGAGLLGVVVLPLVALAPSWGALAATLFVLGATDAWTDAAMNAHGLRVQRRYGRSIINGLHAMWSLAAVGAGLAGAAAAGAGVPLGVHLLGVAVVLAVVSVVAWRFLLGGPESSESGSSESGSSESGSGSSARAEPGPWSAFGSVRVATGALLALSALLVMSSGIEDTAASWSALYLRDQLGAGAFLAGLPFVAFQTTMTLGRLSGDRLVDRWGAVAVARGGALLAAAGVGTALALAHPAAAIAGFAMAGLGVATLFPLTFAAAGSLPGVSSGDGITVVGWLARLGFLVFPPTIGVLADAASIGTGLVLVPMAAVLAAVLARALRPAST